MTLVTPDTDDTVKMCWNFAKNRSTIHQIVGNIDVQRVSSDEWWSSTIHQPFIIWAKYGTFDPKVWHFKE